MATTALTHVLVEAATLRQHASTLLRSAGAPRDRADLVASVLVDADTRGHGSHGIALLPTYLRRIAAGGIDPNASPTWRTKTDVVATLDAAGGFGPVAAQLAAERCAGAAARVGLATVAVAQNNHVGMLAAYRGPFERHGVVALVLNTSGPSVAPPGAQRAAIGNNAACLVVPRTGKAPFVVDFATGVVACGKIRRAAMERRSLPTGVLQDAAGRPTTDPAQLDLGGSVPVFGGHKGLCVSLIVDVLAGGLAAGRGSPRVNRQRATPERVMGCSQLFLGLAPEAFGDANMDAVVDELEAAVMDAYNLKPSRPWFPEQPEQDAAAASRERGIAVPRDLAAELGLEATERSA